jgi:hypothetical protein
MQNFLHLLFKMYEYIGDILADWSKHDNTLWRQRWRIPSEGRVRQKGQGFATMEVANTGQPEEEATLWYSL